MSGPFPFGLLLPPLAGHPFGQHMDRFNGFHQQGPVLAKFVQDGHSALGSGMGADSQGLLYRVQLGANLIRRFSTRGHTAAAGFCQKFDGAIHADQFPVECF